MAAAATLEAAAQLGRAVVAGLPGGGGRGALLSLICFESLTGGMLTTVMFTCPRPPGAPTRPSHSPSKSPSYGGFARGWRARNGPFRRCSARAVMMASVDRQIGASHYTVLATVEISGKISRGR